MPWFRIEDNFHQHPKVMDAGNAAAGLWLRCGTYAAHNLTDGRIPGSVAKLYGRPVEIKALVETGLWERSGGDFVMHDYLEYNPSADEVRRQRSDRSESKRAAGIARARSAIRDPITGKFQL